MALKFNSVNITTKDELENSFVKNYLDYLKEMDNTYIGYADGKNIISDVTYYKTIIEAMGGKYDDEFYKDININWFYDKMCDLFWFEDSPANSHYQNYVLVINNSEKMFEENIEKKYVQYYLDYLKDIVNWWTNEIITCMVGGPNARRNFTVLLVNENSGE